LAQATKAKFLEAGPFHQALKTRVERYFQDSGRSQRDLPGMYAKTAVLLGWFAASYAFLVFLADSPWSAILGCLSLGLAMAGIGFSVQHDAGHGGYSDRRSVNRSMAWMLIEETCREHGVRYHAQESVRAAVGSHVRWLKQMGRPKVAEAVS
jgi:linoleoyl-CoA desaturase